MKNGENLGEALSRVRTVVDGRDGIHVVHTAELKRRDRELLIKVGFCRRLSKGGIYLVRPDIRQGDSSAWYATFWDFLYVYLTHFYGEDYTLSAESSLDLH